MICRLAQRTPLGDGQPRGHRTVDIGLLDFPLLRSQADWQHGELPATLKPAQDDIGWAEHLVLFFPLWLGDMPALLKGFLEQVARVWPSRPTAATRSARRG